MLLHLSPSNRNGAIGFGCSLGFLLFVSKFNEFVQAYKAKKNIKKSQAIAHGIFPTLAAIFRKTCGYRELYTVSMLSLSLLLRTFGSVWVANHWGKIVKAMVTRNFGLFKKLMAEFGGATIGLAVLNALLKYYIAKLREQVFKIETKHLRL
jgi:hypothetical protein